MDNFKNIATGDLEKELFKRKQEEDLIKRKKEEEELKIKKQEALDNLPKIISNPNLEDLIELTRSVVEEVVENGRYPKDIDQYVFESVMTTFYGKDIFRYLNDKT